MKEKNNYFYLGLITVVWFLAYVFCTVFWEQKLGWDEINYMSVAEGIVRDFDFSGRSYTIMGLLKHGFPATLINFPLYSIYLAVFFKLFGSNIHVAYFSNWLCALGVCVLLYFIFLMLSEGNRKASFIVSMSYLFTPGIIRNIDTAMMEQAGCFLLALSMFLMLQDYVKGSFNYLTVLKFAICFLVLWVYKSLFLGIFFGAFVFIFLAYNAKLSGKEIKTKIPLPVFVLLSYGIFAVLFFIVKNFVFLPVAPMLTFTSELEQSQTYATFSDAFLRNFPDNIYSNIYHLFNIIIYSFFVFPTAYSATARAVLPFTSYAIYVGAYFFLFFIALALLFASWKKMTSIQKLFSCFAIFSIVSFNLVFNFLFSTTIENIWRYNVYYLPLYLCFIGLIIKLNLEYLQPFAGAHPRVSKALLLFLLLFIYLPLFLSMINIQSQYWEAYHQRARMNADIVRSVAGATKPKFIYFNDGIHSTFTDYPLRQVFKDATNDQLLAVNMILPSPMEYLFLKPTDWLFKNNQELILMSAPIINDQYKFVGVVKDQNIVVYRLST